MTLDINAWVALFQAALALGTDVYTAVHQLASNRLSHEDLLSLEAAWNADVIESAHNAGIPASPDTPLP